MRVSWPHCTFLKADNRAASRGWAACALHGRGTAGDRQLPRGAPFPNSHSGTWEVGVAWLSSGTRFPQARPLQASIHWQLPMPASSPHPSLSPWGAPPVRSTKPPRNESKIVSRPPLRV